MGSSRCCQGAFDYFDSDDDGMLVGSEIIEVPKKDDKSGREIESNDNSKGCKGSSKYIGQGAWF